MNIIIAGFMGTGKTVVGQFLAKKLGWPYVDTDALIVKKEGREINDIFANSGEDYFRNVETSVIKNVVKKNKHVIAIGGGAIIRDENYNMLKSNGKIFCLTATPDVIYDRLKQDNSRPLLKVDDPLAKIKHLLEARDPYYKKADYQIDTVGKSVEEIVLEIEGRL